MRITRENYEKYFIDYLDGNLTDREIEMVEVFLFQNPDLRTELEGLENILVDPEKFVYPDKEGLKKTDLTLPIGKDNFEDFCIASAQGDLDEFHSEKLMDYCAIHPESLDQYLLYKQLHLSPDHSIRFPFKDNLKRQVKFLPGRIIYPALSVAATLILFFLVIKYPDSQNPQTENNDPAYQIPETSQYSGTIDSKQDHLFAGKYLPDSGKSQLQLASFSNRLTDNDKNTKVEIVKKNSSATGRGTNVDFIRISNPTVEMNVPLLSEKDVDFPSHIFQIPIEEIPISNDFLRIEDLARREVNEKILGKPENNYSKPTIWEIAGAGINGINRIVDGNMRLEKKEDPEGKSKKIIFESKFFFVIYIIE